MITIYTDGAARGNPGPGGYGVVMKFKEHRKELCEGFRLTTNNRMELLAVIKGLEALKGEGFPVTVFSDSKYVVDAVEKGWLNNWVKKGWKNVKNVDLWQRFLKIYKKHNVKFHWLKGHAGHLENERCDRLAVMSSENGNLLVDEGYENSIK